MYFLYLFTRITPTKIYGMPELPDLEVFAFNLDKRLSGKKLKHIQVVKKTKFIASEQSLRTHLEGKKLKSVQREGKELRFIFTANAVLGIHMMLKGALHWKEEELPRHALLVMDFGKDQLVLTDYQRQARVFLNPEESEVPDALSRSLTASYWKEQLQSRSQVKKLLMDQHVVRGIGNAYADEILWEARVSPFSVAAAIPPKVSAKLRAAIPRVLKAAVREIKKRDPERITGELRDFLKIHNAHKKKSPDGHAIKVERKGRVTYYTDEQELYT